MSKGKKIEAKKTMGCAIVDCKDCKTEHGCEDEFGQKIIFQNKKQIEAWENFSGNEKDITSYERTSKIVANLTECLFSHSIQTFHKANFEANSEAETNFLTGAIGNPLHEIISDFSPRHKAISTEQDIVKKSVLTDKFKVYVKGRCKPDRLRRVLHLRGLGPIEWKDKLPAKDVSLITKRRKGKAIPEQTESEI